MARIITRADRAARALAAREALAAEARKHGAEILGDPVVSNGQLVGYPQPLGVQLLGQPQRWQTYRPGLAPTGADAVEIDGDEYAVVDSYTFTDPSLGAMVSVGLVQITAAR